jgi:hypothetical protein
MAMKTLDCTLLAPEWAGALRLAVAVGLVLLTFGRPSVAQDGPEGEEFIVAHAGAPDKRGKGKPPETVCWLPKGCAYVRGVVVGHPMIAALATDARFRRVAAAEGLGTMLVRDRKSVV